ncbi:glycosyltransferase [Ilumatobacter sp.]|uniref:glycosyltransferase n=1 Tax=Ilumatobacter sp. TaxID=1967498 RepID=UPI003C426682
MIQTLSSAPSPQTSQDPSVDIAHVVVVIPACDEEDSIVECLQSVAAARRRLPAEVSCSVTVVADRCTDRTVSRALAALAGGDGDVVLESNAGIVGTARHLGVECALLDLGVEPRRVWIANTDGDTVVPPDWLTTHLDIARSGAIGAAGVVELRELALCRTDLVELFDRTYLRRPDGTHPHVHGANMGCRADAFRAAGGWNPLATGEDHDLWNRLRRVGPVTASTALTVTTSARLVGRAPAGFAANLAALDRELEDLRQTVA